MDYAAWKLFIDAAERGSLSKVALAYGTSQPHISRQIGELEQECGGRLFERTGRRSVRGWPVLISLRMTCALRPARQSAT
jgi:DNA-binding transcriptional LysR family regulator